jgi:hypothetical protein
LKTSPYFQQIPSPLFSNVPEDMAIYFFYASSSFWKQIIEIQSISLQSFDDLDQLANNIIQQILCSSHKI